MFGSRTQARSADPHETACESNRSRFQAVSFACRVKLVRRGLGRYAVQNPLDVWGFGQHSFFLSFTNGTPGGGIALRSDKTLGNLVCRTKTDAAGFGEAMRVLAHDLDCLCPVHSVNPGSPGGADTMGMEKHQ